MALDLIQPVVPDANQNEGAKLGLQGLLGGLAAAARFAEMRRQSENEILKLATEERIAQDQHAFEREKLYKDSEVQDALTKAHTDYYKAAGDALKIRAEAYAKGANNVVNYNQQRQALVNEVDQNALELKLNDPEFRAKEPVKFAANVMQFKDAWGLSDLPEVKNAVKQYQAMADQQKIPLKIGATFDEDKGIWVGGKHESVPIWQIVRNLQDPLQAEDTANALQASGHMKVIQDFETIAGTKVPVTRSEPSPLIKSALEQGKGVQFQRVPSRVPPAMLPKAAARGTSPTELPAPDLPADTTTDEPQASNTATPKFDPTDTDMIIGHAKAAIAQGAAPAAVAQRLQQDFGIDPSVLFEAEAA